MIYDFVEIGTSDFYTEIENAGDKQGLSIEPLQLYMDNLPTARNVRKLSCAVSDKDGTGKVYWVDPKDIEANKLPYWVRGCNSLNTPHPKVDEVLSARGLEGLVKVSDCKIVSWDTLLIENKVDAVKFLKIDTEGHDTVIINAMLDSSLSVLPERIMFEYNYLTDEIDFKRVEKRLRDAGYSTTIDAVQENCLCELNSKDYNIHFFTFPTWPIKYYDAIYGSDPYNQRTYLLNNVLREEGIKTYLYGFDDSEMDVTEKFVLGKVDDPIFKARSQNFGDWPTEMADRWGKEFVKALEKNLETGTVNSKSIFIFNTTSESIPYVCNKLKELNLKMVEYPVSSLYSSTEFKIFESSSYMHFYMGLKHSQRTNDLPWHDMRKVNTDHGDYWGYRTIPPIMDIENYVPTTNDPEEDYYLYMGRGTHVKGVSLVINLATHFKDKKFVFVFNNVDPNIERIIRKLPNTSIEMLPTFERKIELLQKAKCTLAPSLFVEPFGNVHVEGFLCGTPTISTTWGSYAETVDEGVNGFSCLSWSDFLAAFDKIDALDRESIAEEARHKYNNVGKFDEFFKYISHRKTGWYNT